jgi:hypothetical protein
VWEGKASLINPERKAGLAGIRATWVRASKRGSLLWRAAISAKAIMLMQLQGFFPLILPKQRELHFQLFSNYSYLVFSNQKYSRLRCLLPVKELVICFYLGWSGSILQF